MTDPDIERRYEPWDQYEKLGREPWVENAALAAWEAAHGHDVRLKCYVEFGCQVIEPALERQVETLRAENERLETFVKAMAADHCHIHSAVPHCHGHCSHEKAALARLKELADD